MSCPFEIELTAYLDGELEEATRAQLEAHLPGCSECGPQVATLRAAVGKLKALPDLEPSPALRRAVLSRVADPTWSERMSAWLRPSILVPTFGLAAAAVVALVVSRPGAGLTAEDPAEYELAANLELVEDYEVVGMESLEDLEVIEQLHELEVAQ